MVKLAITPSFIFSLVILSFSVFRPHDYCSSSVRVGLRSDSDVTYKSIYFAVFSGFNPSPLRHLLPYDIQEEAGSLSAPP